MSTEWSPEWLSIWERVPSGLDRAVAWIKANETNYLLRRFGFSFFINGKTGIEVRLGSFFEDEPDCWVALEALFKGRSATKFLDGSHIRYCIQDDEALGLCFCWTVIIPATSATNVPEQIVI